MCNEITYPFPDINGPCVDFGEWISNYITHFTGRVIIINNAKI